MYLYPSAMCIRLEDLRAETAALEQAGVDGFHIDIMDGNFVPNFALGRSDIEAMQRLTKKPLDVHLMVSDSDTQAARFAELGVQAICVHLETSVHIDRTLQTLKKKGVQAGIAINPGTPVALLGDILSAADFVLLMTVNPGFAGQAYIEYCTQKVAALAELRKSRGLHFEIRLDGAMSEERVRALHLLGADGFVLGTAALFGKQESYGSIIHRLKQASE